MQFTGIEIIVITGVVIVAGLLGFVVWLQLQSKRAHESEISDSLRKAQDVISELRFEVAELKSVRADRDRLRDEIRIIRNEKSDIEQRFAGLAAEHKAAQTHNEEKLAELNSARDKLSESFKLTANEILEASRQKLTKQGNESLESLLKPLREQLEEFQKKVADDSEKRVGQASEMRTLIETLHKDAMQMGVDAQNLTNALRSQSKIQGDWGEFVLSSILERAGLREGEEFFAQESTTNSDGIRKRPDVLVKMPNNHQIVIDSKVSLKAFDLCVNAETDEERSKAIKQHVASVRTHIRQLGEKDYSREYDGVNFTLMFVPLEGAASLALQSDPDLAAYAWDRDIMITSPTTLMMAMRTVQNLWVVERQNQNAKAIAQRAGVLYDKFEGFVVDLDKIGSRLTQAQDAWQGARSKLTDGAGNLVRQVEMLKTLGASTKKSLPMDLVSAAEEQLGFDALENDG